MSRPYDPEKHTAEVNHLEVAISRESYDPKNAVIDYDLDPFAIQEAQKADDYLEFRSLGWFKAGLLASAEFLAIGMLSYPSIFMRLGMVGGILATLAFSIFAVGRSRLTNHSISARGLSSTSSAATWE